MARETVVVKGYKDFLRAASRAERSVKREIRAEFRRVGQHVRADAEKDFRLYDAKSAAGYRVVVRQRGISVEQSLRKTTGARPDFGALQMRKALLPALKENKETVERGIELALDRIADKFERS